MPDSNNLPLLWNINLVDVWHLVIQVVFIWLGYRWNLLLSRFYCKYFSCHSLIIKITVTWQSYNFFYNHAIFLPVCLFWYYISYWHTNAPTIGPPLLTKEFQTIFCFFASMMSTILRHYSQLCEFYNYTLTIPQTTPNLHYIQGDLPSRPTKNSLWSFVVFVVKRTI